MANRDNSYMTGLAEAAREGSTDALCQLFAATVSGQYELARCILIGDGLPARETVKNAYVAALNSGGDRTDDHAFLSELNRINLQLCCALTGGENKKTGIKNIVLRQILALPGNEGPALFLRYMRGFDFRRIASILNIERREAVQSFRSGRKRLGIGANVRPRGRRIRPGSLNAQEAEALLDELLSECRMDPREASFEELETYNVYRQERYGFQKGILLFLLLAFLTVPFFFTAPKVTLERLSAGNEAVQTFALSVRNRIPVKSVSASIRGDGLIVRQTEKDRYELNIDRCGELRVRVKLVNGQELVLSTLTDVPDRDVPVLLEQRVRDGMVELFVEDYGSDIQYEEVYSVDTVLGTYGRPESWEEGVIRFAVPERKLKVCIPDNKGNSLMVMINPV